MHCPRQQLIPEAIEAIFGKGRGAWGRPEGALQPLPTHFGFQVCVTSTKLAILTPRRQLCGTTHLYSGCPLKLHTWKPFSMAAAAHREGGAAVELERHALARHNTTANKSSGA